MQGNTNGLLLINDYEPPPGYSIFNRPWYRAIMDNPSRGKMVVGLLYREAKTNELLLCNEIGSIALHIEQLARDALLAKNRELEVANQKILSINAELEERNREMERLATHDFLTGIYNRRKLEEILAYEYDKFGRYGTPLSVVIFDIDHFKSINDSFGHKAGDLVLQEVSQLVKNNLRKTDSFGRWGGEEFLIILSNTPLLNGREVAEKVRKRVEQSRFSIPSTITISMGLGEAQEKESLDRFLQRVDRYLYIAKMNGRNRTIWTSEG